MAISSKITFNIINKIFWIVKKKLSISTFLRGLEKIFPIGEAVFYLIFKIPPGPRIFTQFPEVPPDFH